MIFSLLIIHNYNRVSSITRVLHNTTWDYFTSNLPDHFSRSPKVVKEAIITDINDLVQDFWSTLSDEAVGATFFAMRRLFEILQKLSVTVKVCFDTISDFGTSLIKFYRCLPTSGSLIPTEAKPSLWYCLMGIERFLNSQFQDP
jgi:hypothetical protein